MRRDDVSTFKERVEENVAIWLLGSLPTGFLSGIAAYKSLQEIAGLETVPKTEHDLIDQKINELQTHADQLQRLLDAKSNQPIDRVNVSKPSTQHTSNPSIKKSSPNLAPQLKGMNVLIYFPNVGAAKAVEVKQRLEGYGAKVRLSPDEVARPSTANEIVFYAMSGDVSAAVQATKVLASYGFSETIYTPGPNTSGYPPSTDYIYVYLWP